MSEQIYELKRWGQNYDRTTIAWQFLVESGLKALDSGDEEVSALLVRPNGNVRITFKKEPEPEPRYSGKTADQFIVDDPHVVDFPNG